MLGVDVSRHQPSAAIDWAAWRRAGVGFAWIKGTDGFGLAPVERATRKVRDAKAAGIPVGLYGYAQLGDPVQQANILVNECNFQDAWGIMPALDLEDPHPVSAASRSFAIAYLRQMKNRGVARPVLYANTSMLAAINASTIPNEVPGTLIWEANYGPNNGVRNALPARPWKRNVHQYTSVGRLPGYSGNLDLNEAFDNLIFNREAVEDVNLTDSMKAFIWPHNETVDFPFGKVVADGWSYAQEAATNTRAILEAVTNDGDLTEARLREVYREEAVKAQEQFMDRIAEAVREGVGEGQEDQAAHIVELIGQKLKGA